MNVWVAVWEHEYGTDMAAFSSFERVEDWKNVIARQWWEHEFQEELPDDDENLGDRYFTKMNNGEAMRFNESFSARLCELNEVLA